MSWRSCDIPTDVLLDRGGLPTHALGAGVLKALAANGSFWREDHTGALALYRPADKTLVTWQPLDTTEGLPDFQQLFAPSAPAGWIESNRLARQTLRIDGDWEAGLSPQLRRHLRKGRALPNRLVWLPRSPEGDAVLRRAVVKFQALRPEGPYDHGRHLNGLLALPNQRVRTGVLEVGGHRAFFVITEFAEVVCADAHFTFMGAGASLNLTTLLHGALIVWARERGATQYNLGMHLNTALPAYDRITAYKSLWRGELHPTRSWRRVEGK
jgi:hypothetical protein